MKPLEEARAEVLAPVTALGSERVPLEEARGRVLAHDVTAPHDVPPFANSAMDGYAVIAADVASAPVTLRILEDVPAGSVASRPLEPGAAIKIMTGAPMPEGADAVVKVEVTRQLGPDRVEVLEAVPIGTAIRPPGGDLARGSLVLAAGETLGPPELALLATVGCVRVAVGKRPRVAVMATGDELRPAATAELAPGQIRDSNRPLMRALVEEAGGEVVDLGIIGDRRDALVEALTAAAATTDVVLTSGGVSMGEYDLVKAVLTEMGTVDFWQVAMQPAKPFAFGFVGDVPLFGLPGNPVSVLVAFEQFARPALLKMQGATSLLRPRIRARLASEVVSDPAKVVFMRVRLDAGPDGLVASSSGGQSSNVLSALAAADGLAVIPVGVERLPAGAEVEVELFRYPTRGFGR